MLSFFKVKNVLKYGRAPLFHRSILASYVTNTTSFNTQRNNSNYQKSLIELRQHKTCIGGRNTEREFSSFPLMKRSLIDVSDEVAQGFVDKKPVVALESTIITHGMPFPKNLETARDVEQIVRDQGAIPATIAVVNGRISVGLKSSTLSSLAEGRGNSVKVSRRDLPRVVGLGLNGGTTVSGTMVIAARMGIPIFVTGGIGGVHRSGETTMDISADLTELGRTPVCVVSSGVKSILDIGRTLEYLETQGVCVTTFGSSTEFPAFYTRSSGFHSPGCVDCPLEAAKIVKAALDLQLDSGLLIAVPVPEEFSMNQAVMETAIQEALQNAEKQGIKGKDVTPFILEAVANITKGKSLQTNIALIKNNAKVGSQIAVELNKMINYPDSSNSNKSTSNHYNYGTSTLREGKEENKYFVSSKREDKVTEEDCSGKMSAKDNIEEKSVLINDLGKTMYPVVIGGSNIDFTVKVLEEGIEIQYKGNINFFQQVILDFKLLNPREIQNSLIVERLQKRFL